MMRISISLVIWLFSLWCFVSEGLPTVVDNSGIHPSIHLPINNLSRSSSSRYSRRTILDSYRQYATSFAIFLPAQVAAAFFDDTLDTMWAMATTNWFRHASELPALTLEHENLYLTFVSSNLDIPVPWEFVGHFCQHLAEEVNKGWTGLYEGVWVHTSTHVMIHVKMTMSMVAAAA